MSEQDPVRKLKNKALEKAYKKDSKDHPKIEEGKTFDAFMQDEEWKPFPKDKVNRSIEKKEKNDPRRKAQTAVKNFKTKATDTHKQKQFMTGKSYNKINNAYHKATSDENKALDKFSKKFDERDAAEKAGKHKKAKKLEKKVDKHLDTADRHSGRKRALDAVARSYQRTSVSQDKQQAEINKKSKEDRATAKRMLNRAGLESAHKKPAVKGATKGGFKKEHMDFTDWLDSLQAPLYEVNDKPACPPGYKWDKKLMMCVPRTEKDDVGKNTSKDRHPDNGPGYNVIGSHGMNGAPYAYEEPATDSGSGGE